MWFNPTIGDRWCGTRCAGLCIMHHKCSVLSLQFHFQLLHLLQQLLIHFTLQINLRNTVDLLLLLVLLLLFRLLHMYILLLLQLQRGYMCIRAGRSLMILRGNSRLLWWWWMPTHAAKGSHKILPLLWCERSLYGILSWWIWTIYIHRGWLLVQGWTLRFI